MSFHRPRLSLQIIGNVGQKPELRKTATTERSVTNVSVAVDDSYKNSEGVKVERTEWIRATAWGKTAEILVQYLDKGHKVLFEGKPSIETWEQDGETRVRQCLTVSSFELLGSPNRGASEASAEADAPAEPVDEDDIPF